MGKKAFSASLVLFLVLPALAFSGGGGSTVTCDTKYPVILAHGAFVQAEIFGIVDAWWGIEDALEGEGADVYITSVNGVDGTGDKAGNWKYQALEILAITGAQKFNVIGHSHGTIYTRTAISNMGLQGKAASHTSLCGPHQGTKLADIFVNTLPQIKIGNDFTESLFNGLLELILDTDAISFDFPISLYEIVTMASDLIYLLLMGDDNPDTARMGHDLTTDHMRNSFNPNTPDYPGVYYQSWAAKVKTVCPSLVLQPAWMLVLILEGANDGLISVNSAKWGNFRGVESGAWWSTGVDHINMVNHLFGVTPGFDAPGFYVDIVSDLKNRGF